MGKWASSFQGGSIVTKKLKDGSLVFRLFWRVRDNKGTWVRVAKTLPPGTTRKEAQADLQRILSEVNAQSLLPTRTQSPLSFDDLVTQYLDSYFDKKQVRQSTRDGYSAVLRHWILPFFKNTLVRDVTPQVVSQFMTHLVNEKLSSKYQKNIYSLLSFLFEIARTYDFIQASPIRPLLHRPAVIRTEKPTLPLDKGRVFFLAIPEEYKAPIALLMLTGMRQGEMLGLRWQDIDFENRMIHKRNVVYRGKLVEGLKETSRQAGKLRRHTVGMSDLLKRILEEHKAASRFTQPDSFVFCREDGRPLDPDHIRRSVIYPALEAAQIPIERHGSGLHLLRHTCISEASKKLGIKAAQDLAGHADIQITANVYSHVDTETKLAAAAVMGTSFDFVG